MKTGKTGKRFLALVVMAAGIPLIACAEAPGDIFKPTPEQQLREAEAWKRWQELMSQWFYLSEFAAPDPATTILSPHLTDLLITKRNATRVTKTLESFLAAMNQACGPWAMAQPVAVTITAKEDAAIAFGMPTPAILLTGGLAKMNEEDWKFVTRRGGVSLPGRFVQALSAQRERQLAELEGLKTDLESLTQLLISAPDSAKKMQTLLAEAWLAYVAKFALELRQSQSVKDLRDRLKAHFASSPPEWPQVEKRILDEGLPADDLFDVWKTAVMMQLQERMASLGRTSPREAPRAFATSVLERMSKKHTRPTRYVIPDDVMEEE